VNGSYAAKKTLDDIDISLSMQNSRIHVTNASVSSKSKMVFIPAAVIVSGQDQDVAKKNFDEAKNNVEKTMQQLEFSLEEEEDRQTTLLQQLMDEDGDCDYTGNDDGDYDVKPLQIMNSNPNSNSTTAGGSFPGYLIHIGNKSPAKMSGSNHTMANPMRYDTSNITDIGHAIENMRPPAVRTTVAAAAAATADKADEDEDEDQVQDQDKSPIEIDDEIEDDIKIDLSVIPRPPSERNNYSGGNNRRNNPNIGTFIKIEKSLSEAQEQELAFADEEIRRKKKLNTLTNRMLIEGKEAKQEQRQATTSKNSLEEKNSKKNPKLNLPILSIDTKEILSLSLEAPPLTLDDSPTYSSETLTRAPSPIQRKYEGMVMIKTSKLNLSPR